MYPMMSSRSLRLPDELWFELLELATLHDRLVSYEARVALRTHVAGETSQNATEGAEK